MRTTGNIDDRLLAEAPRVCQLSEKTVLIREALKALIEHEVRADWRASMARSRRWGASRGDTPKPRDSGRHLDLGDHFRATDGGLVTP